MALLTLFILFASPSDLVISEIMYNPDGTSMGPDELMEWVELYYAEAVNTLTQLSTDLMPQVILVGVVNTDRYRDLYPWPRPDGAWPSSRSPWRR